MKAKRVIPKLPGCQVTQADFNRYAEMDKVEKNKISHRFRALEKLKTWLQES
jgi:inosine/xanthosine triphosphate pyrophosphatase family protein